MNTLVFDTSTFMTLSQEELMEIEAGANWIVFLEAPQFI